MVNNAQDNLIQPASSQQMDSSRASTWGSRTFNFLVPFAGSCAHSPQKDFEPSQLELLGGETAEGL
jgi:hypothetical protein